ncbi:MAG: X-Pro dipeptidyl-peptidase C-terminal non-catalytic domain, partial [Frankiales bacterium]|nr:X-Pro dipeptidyl-peptidase C-terminal non-catalytic domain [Frankiales bacterium]
ATRTSTPGSTGGTVSPLPVGIPVALEWELFPISVLLPEGSRVRVTLAGSDTPLFRHLGDARVQVLDTSWIDLPEQSS